MSETLITLAQKTGDALKKKGWIVVTAESCTAGGLSYWLTSLDGSSTWFERGFVTYSDEAKIELLGVKPATLESFGAVSAETAKEMAEGALKNSYADICVGITGIAGPAGGTHHKPVGTVWIAWASRHFSTLTELNVFKGERQEVREQTIIKAMEKIISVTSSEQPT